MKAFYRREHLSAGQSVQVICSKPAIVMVMTDAGYDEYQDGQGAGFYGGYFTHFPAIITVPKSGYWNIVIDQFSDIAQEMSCSINYLEKAQISPDTVEL